MHYEHVLPDGEQSDTARGFRHKAEPHVPDDSGKRRFRALRPRRLMLVRDNQPVRLPERAGRGQIQRRGICARRERMPVPSFRNVRRARVPRPQRNQSRKPCPFRRGSLRRGDDRKKRAAHVCALPGGGEAEKGRQGGKRKNDSRLAVQNLRLRIQEARASARFRVPDLQPHGGGFRADLRVTRFPAPNGSAIAGKNGVSWIDGSLPETIGGFRIDFFPHWK